MKYQTSCGKLGADIFIINDKHYLYIVGYQSKFPVIKQVAGFSAHNLINGCRIIFSEYMLPRKLMSDTGIYFTSKVL